MKTRRSFVKRAGSWLAALGIGTASAAAARPTSETASRKRAIGPIVRDGDVPLFSPVIAFGNLLFVSGIGAHFEGDIRAHTDHVLKEMEKRLTEAGSSMQRVLKVTVFLHDLQDYQAMNEVFRGRFGDTPPVRSTVSCYGGVPGNSLVEMDCIAALD
jgi:enamine deaminase RidA (YjgF/YER057c/UK114 family)